MIGICQHYLELEDETRCPCTALDGHEGPHRSDVSIGHAIDVALDGVRRRTMATAPVAWARVYDEAPADGG